MKEIIFTISALELESKSSKLVPWFSGSPSHQQVVAPQV